MNRHILAQISKDLRAATQAHMRKRSCLYENINATRLPQFNANFTVIQGGCATRSLWLQPGKGLSSSPLQRHTCSLFFFFALDVSLSLSIYISLALFRYSYFLSLTFVFVASFSLNRFLSFYSFSSVYFLANTFVFFAHSRQSVYL